MAQDASKVKNTAGKDEKDEYSKELKDAVALANQKIKKNHLDENPLDLTVSSPRTLLNYYNKLLSEHKETSFPLEDRVDICSVKVALSNAMIAAKK